MKKKLIFIVAILFSLALLNGCNKQQIYESADEMVAAAAKSVTQITVDDFKKKYDEGELYTLIDVREPGEYNAGFIPGSVNIPAGLLIFNIGKDEFWESEMLYKPEKDEEIIVYCKKGKRGIMAAKSLHELGYKNVKNIEGGWKNWEMNFPLEYEKNLDAMHEAPHAEEGGC